MTAHRFSELARLDLIEIADYTLNEWGLEQAIRYLDSLDGCFRLIAANPRVGRKCDLLRPGYRRIEHEKHVIFYRAEPDSILIVRILHQRMIPETQPLEEQE